MHLSSMLLFLCVGALMKCAAGSEWCYTGCEHTPSHWGDVSAFCLDKRQSPIDIATGYVKTDPNLRDFAFVNFTSKHVIKSITNNGHTVKCKLEENAVEVSGGGLNATYSALQFHFHWGDKEHHPGSEHTINRHRYPMEMHIVSLKKDLTVTEATKDSEGIAVLGFFINATEDGNTSGPWSTLTSYLTNITDAGTEANITHEISINDLIGEVNLTKFYRYLGSLTTPDCNEAVVWTVFQEPININKDLIQLFPEKTGLRNVYRPRQNLNTRQVYASPATPLTPGHSWCYDDHHCSYSPSYWHVLPQSHCGGQHQSPINIDTKTAMEDESLSDFTFTKFDDKHAIKYIINTGHAVKCVLKEDMVEVSGGGLAHVYSTLQFHFHWGSHDSDGSEHTLDSKRYPMEMHIVNKRKDLTLEQALQTPDGLAVLGFFIQATDSTKSSGGSEHHETDTPSQPASDMDAWKKLTSYLPDIKNISSQVNVTKEISIDDLLGGVSRDAFYRYNGSLTTPSCNEAVVWTVFKESIKVEENLMNMFPSQAGYHDVFRPAQPLNSRKIYTRSASSAPGPTIQFLLLACLCAFFV